MGRVHYEGILLSSMAQSCRMNEKINIVRCRDELSRVLIRRLFHVLRYLYKGGIHVEIDNNNQDPTKNPFTQKVMHRYFSFHQSWDP